MKNEEIRYILSRSAYVGFLGRQCVFSIGNRQEIFYNEEEYLPILKASAIWKEANTIKFVVDKLIKSGLTLEESVNATNFLIEKHHVVYDESIKLERYSRHYLYYGGWSYSPNDVQEKISSSHVIILGCGGIGNHLAINLATAGINKLTLIDDDLIELSNLTRQHMFTEDDVGLHKIDVLAREIKRRNKNVQINTIKKSINSQSDLACLPKADLIALSADYPDELASWVNLYAVKNKFPFINIGYVGDIAVFGPFYIPNESGCFACNSNIVPDINPEHRNLHKYAEMINKGFQAPSFVAVNAMSSAMATNDIIRYLGGSVKPLSTNKRVGIHSYELKIEYQECPVKYSREI
ncbi:HesA/MoeB/ThiF family protein [Xenorhabdus doucetiae]|nr:ThiF family adenylyltransferase [Xenorhabdus doucetiae]CDG19546.1 Similar to MccB protein of Escherichia coli [Xenorhabdus doucetiae]